MTLLLMLLLIPIAGFVLIGGIALCVVLCASQSARATCRRWVSQAAPLALAAATLVLIADRSQVLRHEQRLFDVQAAESARRDEHQRAKQSHSEVQAGPRYVPLNSPSTHEVAHYSTEASEPFTRYERPPAPKIWLVSLLMFAIVGGCCLTILGWRKTSLGLRIGLVCLVLIGVSGLTAITSTEVVHMPAGRELNTRDHARSVEVRDEVEAQAPAAVPLQGVAVSGAEPSRITVFDGEFSTGTEVSELPDWVHTPGGFADGPDQQRLILVSGRYADIAEAEAELLDRLRPQLASYVARDGIRIAPETISLEDVHRAAVRTRRVYERFEVEVGEFTPEVVRVTWEVSLRPSVRSAMWDRLRLASRNERLGDLAIGFGLLTLVFGACAAGLRLDDATQGRYRRRIAAGAVAVVAAASGVLLS